MSIANVTYQTLMNLVITYITSNCKNITDFTGMEACFKSGYTNYHQISTSGTAYVSSATETISGNAVSQVTSDTVTSELNSYVTNVLLITDTSAVVSTPEFINFFDNMVNFCCQHLLYTSSQFSSNTWLIYSNNSSQTSTTKAGTLSLIYAKTMNDIYDVLQDRVNLNIKSVPVQYSYSFV